MTDPITPPPNPPPPAPPTGGPPPAPPSPPTPPTPGADDEPATAPKWLNMRLDQVKRSTLKALGFDSEDQAKERLGALKKLEDEAEDRRKAQLSEVEREKEARLAAERDRDAARQRADATERASKVTRACAERGIKNLDYAEYVLAKAELTADFGKLLDGMIAERPDLKAALQLTVPTTTTTPPNTTDGKPPPPPAPPAPPSADAMAMKPDDWAAERRRLGIR
jgi:hypothetical protein